MLRKMLPAILFHSNSPNLFKFISTGDEVKVSNTLCIAFLSVIHVVKRSALIMFTSEIIAFYVTKYWLYLI